MACQLWKELVWWELNIPYIQLPAALTSRSKLPTPLTPIKGVFISTFRK